LLTEGPAEPSAPLLPVKVSTPIVLPTERAVRTPLKAERSERASIEVKLAKGTASWSMAPCTANHWRE
jgi:hypothetical protein